MVAPDNYAVHFFILGASLVSDLADGSALIESGQGREVLLGDRGCVVRADQRVRVGWVAHNDDLDGLLGYCVDGTTLSLEDLSIGLEKVGSLHTGASWASTNKHSDVSILESNERVHGGDNVSNTSVGTVLELHDESLEHLLSLRELNELKNDFLVGSKHSSLSNEVAKEGTNLTSSSSDGNANRSNL